MSKPEDVTDEAWGRAEIAAKEATRDAMRDPLMPYYITVTPYIARAIMAAEKRGEEREREACAALADSVQQRSHHPAWGDTYDLTPAEIAAAILARST